MTIATKLCERRSNSNSSGADVNYSNNVCHNTYTPLYYIILYKLPYSRKYCRELYLADCAKIVENRNWQILMAVFTSPTTRLRDDVTRSR